MQRPDISVVIPTRDRAAFLRVALQSLAAQTIGLPRFEVIVVDDGSVDDTADVCQRLSAVLPVRYQRIEASGTSSAKNLGFFLSRGEIVLFFDDDDAADPGLLEAHVAAHRELGADGMAVLGYTTWHPSLEITPLMEYVTGVGQLLFSYGHFEDAEELDFRFLWAGRTSLKRSFLADNGVFNPDLVAVEDVELGYRLIEKGLRVIHRRAARSYMLRPLTFDDFCRRSERQGEGRWLFAQLHHGPEVDEYCRVDERLAAWEAASSWLAESEAEARRLEAGWSAAAEDDRAGRRAELFDRYEQIFPAYLAKGIWQARQAGVTAPPRLRDELACARE